MGMDMDSSAFIPTVLKTKAAKRKSDLDTYLGKDPNMLAPAAAAASTSSKVAQAREEKPKATHLTLEEQCAHYEVKWPNIPTKEGVPKTDTVKGVYLTCDVDYYKIENGPLRPSPQVDLKQIDQSFSFPT